MTFTPLQRLVARHYAGGEFGHIDDTDLLDELGDTLFTFVVREAGDAECGANIELTARTFGAMLNTAIDQLRSLQNETKEPL